MVSSPLYPFVSSFIPTNHDNILAAKTADLILIMMDATKSDEHRRLLEVELDAVGIRLNKSKPDVVFKRRTTGGVSALRVMLYIVVDLNTFCLLDNGMH